ncbi:hypothetical protein CONLIGDRAFT_674562 [Coniochaeta ligniaria NRRL 30616]|uniref:Uncharacterized protein n=1 Tax=Coniochaeta ligniaria NRRL 30616 TaxID=1408157 RepID=A0A1J7J078_9PEZI|nr:hypothetical protein CONLIGDRAFT_674562 [Coniochaeta ligniaria NRRL 30616]
MPKHDYQWFMTPPRQSQIRIDQILPLDYDNSSPAQQQEPEKSQQRHSYDTSLPQRIPTNAVSSQTLRLPSITSTSSPPASFHQRKAERQTRCTVAWKASATRHSSHGSKPTTTVHFQQLRGSWKGLKPSNIHDSPCKTFARPQQDRESVSKALICHELGYVDRLDTRHDTLPLVDCGVAGWLGWNDVCA